MDEVAFKNYMRVLDWERAKGYLRAVAASYINSSNRDNYFNQEVDKRIDKFIKDMEKDI